MLRKSVRRCFQIGAHVPFGAGSNMKGAARMKNWPDQKLPENFNFLGEDRFRLQPFARDTGRIPRDFVLHVLYRNQPCEIDTLWSKCAADTGMVLDSKRHLREVLKQCRDEDYIHFEKDARDGRWRCLLTRERYEEVRTMVAYHAEQPADASTLRGSAVQDTNIFTEKFREMSTEQKEVHLAKLREATAETAEKLNEYQRTEVDYLPYTDLNGKVCFMWWYETRAAPVAVPELAGSGSTVAENKDKKNSGALSD